MNSKISFTLFYLMLCTLYILPNTIIAQEKLKLESSIKQVVVYQNQAQLVNSVTTSVNEGVTEVALVGLSSCINAQSIQATGKGDMTILGVKLNPNFTKPLKKSSEIIFLQDTLESLTIQVENIENKLDILKKEEVMILSNQVVSGKEKSLTADEFDDYIDIFRDRLTEIKNLESKNERELKKKKEILLNFQNQLNSIVHKLNKPSSEIIVTVQTKAKTTISLEVQYVVQNAGWTPVYDLRSKGTNGAMQLVYRANVYQNSGIDWENVKLKLSTGNPVFSGSKPDLYPWYLNIYQPPVGVKYKSNDKKVRLAEIPIVAEADSEDDSHIENNVYISKPMTVSVQEQQLAAEFDIPVLYSVNSDNKPVLVEIQNYQLASIYKHFSTPKIDNNVYLTSLLTGWEGLNLLSGNANVFFEGSYVGETFLNLSGTSDTMIVSLGIDKKIIAKRELLKDYTSKSFLGNTKKNEYAYEISLKNTKKDAVQLVLEDQIPISQNSEIVVEMIENSGANYDASTGKLTWNLNLASGEEKKVNFRFTIKYPKNKTISGL